jgi:nucleoside-diphosphate-sugar epimerase
MGGETTFVNPVVEPRESLASIEKAKKLLNWQPNQSLEDWIPKYKKQLGI